MHDAQDVLVKYYSPKHLLTIDLGLLFSTLLTSLAQPIRIILEEMSPEEREAASSLMDGGLVAVKSRITISRKIEGAFVRESELEKQIERPRR